MTNPYETPESFPAINESKSAVVFKKRHGCLTAWLVLMIVANSLTAIATPMSVSNIKQAAPDFPVWVVWPISLMAILNVIFAVALLNWKKWGFFGFAVTASITFVLNVFSGAGISQSLVGLSGILILFLVLQIGGDRKGWTQLD